MTHTREEIEEHELFMTLMKKHGKLLRLAERAMETQEVQEVALRLSYGGILRLRDLGTVPVRDLEKVLKQVRTVKRRGRRSGTRVVSDDEIIRILNEHFKERRTLKYLAIKHHVHVRTLSRYKKLFADRHTVL
jgi:hypothetical protein